MPEERKYKDVGARLKQIRQAKYPNMSISDFAAMIGVGYNRYINWETGVSRPLPEQSVELCDKLGLTMDFIYRGVEAALPQNTLKELAERSRLSDQSKSKGKPD